MDKLFYNAIQKYSWAISQNLHPSQTRKLREALKDFEQNGDVYISDSFVRLVFDMIIADLLYQQER